MPMTVWRQIAVSVLAAALLALGGCVDGLTANPVPDGAGDKRIEDRRWSKSRLPRYGREARATAASTPLKLGLLAPLTGPYAAYGRNLVDAALLAAEENDLERPVELLPHDTAGTAAGAARAVADALGEGVAALIGPVVPDAAPDVVAAAVAARAPLLMLHADRRWLEPGVYAVGHAPEAGATRVVDYAYRRNVRSLAALAPDAAYGLAALRGMQAAAAARSMRIAHVETLAPDAPAAAIGAAVGRALKAAGPDGALFLPYPPEALGPFADALAALGADRRPLLLGLETWQSASLAALPGFENAVYAGVDPATTAGFRRRYAARFDTPPARGVELAYDVTAMLAHAGRTIGGQALGPHHLVTPEGYRGLAGPFRLTRDGVVARAYAIVGVRDGRLETLEPAPTRFEADG